MRLVLDDPKQWPPRRFFYQIHELILEDLRISAKSIAEQLDISRERVGSIIYEDFDMRKLSAKWVPKCLKAVKNVNGASRLSKFWNYFVAIQMISCRDWWPWTEPGYITMSRRQNDNQWSGGIAAHPAPKIPSANIHWKSFLLDFGDKTASSLLIILQRAKLLTQSITNLCWYKWRTFWRKNFAGRALVLARKCSFSPVTCNQEETGLPGFPASWSPTLFSGSGPVGLPYVPWTVKQLKFRATA